TNWVLWKDEVATGCLTCLSTAYGYSKGRQICAVLLVQPAQNPGSLKSEETRLENFRAGQLDALASLVLFQNTLQHRFSEHNLKRETRTWQRDKPETP
ncbi:hypothetical protein THAOC_09053, partial [Thalassiosira oceanica]